LKAALRRIQKDIKEHQEEISKAVSAGSCSSFDEYTRSVGVVQGMELSFLMIEDAIEKLGEDDDYDE